MTEWFEKAIDFSNILNVSITASWLILVVIGLRLVLKKAPKWVNVALWGIVALRLLMPFSIESSLSLVPSVETVSDQMLQAEPAYSHGDAQLDIITNPNYGSVVTVDLDDSMDSFQWSMVKMSLVWYAGIAVMSAYTLLSFLILRRRLHTAVFLRDNLYQCETVSSPFVLGILKPKIYLPYGMDDQNLSHVIAHEQAHIRRKDHWWKPLGFLLLTVYWFNPLMWAAYCLLCRDIELACDEKVIAELGNEQRADYTQALVACAVNRRMIAACPLAFGEVGVKDRVKSIMNYRKPTFWIIVSTFAACVTIAVCFLTDPVKEADTGIGATYYTGTVVDSAMSVVNEGDREGRSYITLHCDDGEELLFWMAENYEKPDVDLIGQYVIVRGRIESGTGLLVATNISISEQEFSESLEEAINQAILDHNYSPRHEGMLQVASFKQLSGGNEGIASVDSNMKLIEKATVYGLALHQVFRLEDGILVEEGGSYIPVVLTFAYDAFKGFTLTEYWEPRDGSYYTMDLKAKFNGRPWPDTQKYITEQAMENYIQAMEYYEVGIDVLIHTLLDGVQAKAQFTLIENLLESDDHDVQILFNYSKETLEYCFSQFLNGNQSGEIADTMAAVCKKIISDWGEPLLIIDSDPPLTAQEWFDFYLEQALKHLEEYGQDELMKKYPAACVLLNLTGHAEAALE